MLVSSRFFINDVPPLGVPVYPNADPNNSSDNLVDKFDYIDNNPSAHVDLELMYLRINRRVIKRSEYDISSSSVLSSPLTSIRVGGDGEEVSVGAYIQPVEGSGKPTLTTGYDNYTNFINRIFLRHGIFSRFYPMGKDYIPPGNVPPKQQLTHDTIFHNLIGCHLSILEDFALTFIETYNNFKTLTPTPPQVIHIETSSPMGLKANIIEYTSSANSPIYFNILTNSFGSTNSILQQINFITEKDYEPIP